MNPYPSTPSTPSTYSTFVYLAERLVEDSPYADDTTIIGIFASLAAAATGVRTFMAQAGVNEVLVNKDIDRVEGKVNSITWTMGHVVWHIRMMPLQD
jgi:precorrin-2 methylase